MAFWLYRKEPHSDGSAQYVQERGVVLAGGGLIWEACNAQLKHADVGWTVSGRDLVTAAGEDPGCHAVVIDTAPSRPTVSLFEIRSVAGYSYADWTPLMFTLEQLFADDEAPDSVDAMKHQFSDAACPRLSSGTSFTSPVVTRQGHGTGGNTRTTAVLLWEDAWTFFQEQAAA